MIVGLISDTHGLLRDEAVAALRGSDLIIHAGDVGGGDVLDRLRALATLFAVRGNIDQGAPCSNLPESAVVQVAEWRIYVLHDIHALGLDPGGSGFRAVVSGHSHKPAVAEKNGVLYINPGSAGRRRFRLPVTVALLEVPAWNVRFIDLA